jgi:hypothetical protein
MRSREANMHVDIEHAIEGGGFFSGSTRYVVKLRVTLSPEEYTIVQQRDLSRYVVINHKNPGWDSASEKRRELMHEIFKYDIRKLCAGIEPFFPTPLEAKNFATQAREHIKALKDFIDGNETTGKSESFDL